MAEAGQGLPSPDAGSLVLQALRAAITSVRPSSAFFMAAHVH
jgi:hypothetical protein